MIEIEESPAARGICSSTISGAFPLPAEPHILDARCIDTWNGLM